VDWESGIAGTLSRLWPDRDRAALLALYHVAEPKAQANSGAPYREIMARALRMLADENGLELAPREKDALASSLPDWPVFLEVPRVLGELRGRGWRLGILSNTDPDLLDASLERIGVQPDLAITAADAGSYKPALGHWERFFERSGADRERHVHVAASLFHDIAPARRLGIQAVWINRLGEQSDLVRAAELPDLSGLPEALERLVPAD
jgi:2-haloalkanoic acid dehalogenase type II